MGTLDLYRKGVGLQSTRHPKDLDLESPSTRDFCLEAPVIVDLPDTVDLLLTERLRSPRVGSDV